MGENADIITDKIVRTAHLSQQTPLVVEVGPGMMITTLLGVLLDTDWYVCRTWITHKIDIGYRCQSYCCH